MTPLTPQQRRVAEMVAASPHLTVRQVAAHMYISYDTACSHLQGAYRALGIRRREDLSTALFAADLDGVA